MSQHVSGEGSLFDVPPAAIGRFRVLHQVGAGTSGPVFRAAHPESTAPLAIKLFTLPFAPERVATIVDDLEALVRAMPEVAGACALVDAGVHGSTPYLVSAFAPGDSLDVALKQFGPAALVDLVPRLRALAGALDAAAEYDVLHGALHPRDVLVSDASTWLTGLGAWPVLARHGARLPVRRPYRAPELADTTVSAAADRFAMAAMAFEWMTGRRAPSAFVAGDMAPLPGVDHATLADVFARALNADPEARFPSCGAFVDELAEVEVSDAPDPVPGPTPPETPRAEGRPRRRGSRGASAPPLPLDAFPSEDPAELRLAPVDDTAAAVADEPRQEPPLAPRLQDDESAARPAATATLREPARHDVPGPGPGLLRETGYAPVTITPPASAGVGRLAIGLLLGAILGVGVGYTLWGRDGTAVLPDGPPASQAPAASTDTPPAASPDAGASSLPSAQPGAPGGTIPAPAAKVPPQEPATAATPQPAPSSPRSASPAAPAAAAATPVGNLLVRSTPAGATVFVDNERRGVTPLTLQNVELGTRRVRIVRDGYTAQDRQITLTRSRPSRSVDVSLTRAAPAVRPATPAPAAPSVRTGSLVIESRPTGASIVLNGRRIGTTPMTIDDLEPGTYTVLLELPTFRPITTTVRVVAGARARAAASLVRAQEPQ